MAILYDEVRRIFHLQTPGTSYVIGLVKDGAAPVHLYWGRKIRPGAEERLLRRGWRHAPAPFPGDNTLSYDWLPLEYPGYGTGDFRHPAYEAQLDDGTTAVELIYDSHRILRGKPPLEGLPAVYVESDDEAETLELVLVNRYSGLKAVLSYTVFARHDAIARSVRFVHEGDRPIRLLRALSASVDLPGSRYDWLHLSGAWLRERMIERRRLTTGTQGIESRRGASSHQHNPFIALLSPDADEDHGDVYAMNLVYSGSFAAQAEVDQYGTTRLSIGLNPFDFGWLLEPGESFRTPEAILVYSAEGLGAMSRTFHRLYRTRLCRGTHRDRIRPILINNWEATYFDFTEEKLLEIARSARGLGIELFVLDDGWFGKRNDDTSSLGDWKANERKLPGGLRRLAERVRDEGLLFGLWIEPEMVSPDSDLYRAHPDWCLHVPGRRRTEMRNQLVLDFSREDVCEAVYRMIADILSSAPIGYVKWDMNRNMTEIGSAALPPERQRETAHRYMLGLYRVLDRLTREFPHVLFEGCASGGGRFDPGMLHYMPQTWTSDNTDAVARLKIQYGTSLVYPAIATGAHVSAVPNHQTGRVTPLDMRAHAAMSANFGYELDATALTEEEKEQLRRHVALYKEIRHLVQFGDLYRLLSPFEGDEAAWMYVSEDRAEAVVFYFRVLAEANGPFRRFRLKGLDPDAAYRLEPLDGREDANGSGSVYGGDQLMWAGLHAETGPGDFRSRLWRLTRV
ncbi:MAG: alpha-galactosidase [Thermobacillus sp. ZCTH02-B1]|uniref:alpha-galactosidase n=1 Tax=Thermobacillus sp. ZCTH02-B1 TaxID=1858795 RepID=UPI000B557EE8|nr:alpha-galactosidase [Thermobacillus sp. ZCTH02-B1]OUM95026.1 MAG: alpha-galactosidase [Thermobacillus sp. ZCTH02-B1]